jgi:hypothetical protein
LASQSGCLLGSQLKNKVFGKSILVTFDRPV